MSEAAIVILAAGMSRRLGRPKQVLPLAGEPIVAHVGKAARASSASRVMAVIGGARHQTMGALDGIVDELVINDSYSLGQGTSIAAAIRHLQATQHILGPCEAVVFLLADQPGIQTATIDAVIDAWRNGGRIVTAEYRDQPGHPVLFEQTYWPDLARLDGDLGGRIIISKHPHDVVRVPLDSDSPMDVDTEADWRKLQEHWPNQAPTAE